MKVKLVLSVVLFASLAAGAMAQSDADKSFQLLKSLDGTWSGTVQRGTERMPVTVSFRETSGGSAILSEIQGHGENMISMIHMDGTRLMLTHYCAAGNQPRMKGTASPDGKSIAFDFVDATNLASPDAGHMQRVIFTVLGEGHHTEEWHYKDHEKELVEVFDLQKKG